jgi:mannose-6-phosphate isomerase class I
MKSKDETCSKLETVLMDARNIHAMCPSQLTSCIACSQNALVSEKTKHIDLKYHFVKDHVHLGTIKLRCPPTRNMVSDMSTKPLLGFALVEHRSAIIDISAPMQRYTP